MPKMLKNFIIVFLILFLVAGLMSVASVGGEKTEVAGINTLVSEINTGAVKRIEISGDTIFATLQDENAKRQEIKKEAGQSFSELLDTYDINKEKLAAVDVV